MVDPYTNYFKNRNVEYAPCSGTTLAHTFKSVIPVDKKARILDIGCGLGNDLVLLGQKGYENVFGVDVSDEAVSLCRARGVMVQKIGDITELRPEVDSDRYDLILMFHVLEHIPKESIITTLEHIRQTLLKSQATLYLTVPNAQSNTGCYWAYEDFTHHTLFTAGSLLFVLKTAGFHDIRFLDPDGTEGLNFPWKWLKKILLRLYAKKLEFWNRVTSSSYHEPSPKIYTYEIKALAR